MRMRLLLHRLRRSAPGAADRYSSASLRRARRSARALLFAAASAALLALAVWDYYADLGPDTPRERRLTDPTEEDLFTMDQRRRGAVVLHAIGLLYSFMAIAIVCDELFVPSLEVISERLSLSNDVAGATFMAAGGSAPEFFTSMIGVIQETDIGIGTIVGSAVFNVLFVIGVCALVAPTELALTWFPLARDSLFYVVGLIILWRFVVDGKVEWLEAMILFLWYIAYVSFMRYSGRIEQKVSEVFSKKQKEAPTCWADPTQKAMDFVDQDTGTSPQSMYDDEHIQSVGSDADVPIICIAGTGDAADCDDAGRSPAGSLGNVSTGCMVPGAVEGASNCGDDGGASDKKTSQRSPVAFISSGTAECGREASGSARLKPSVNSTADCSTSTAQSATPTVSGASSRGPVGSWCDSTRPDEVPDNGAILQVSSFVVSEDQDQGSVIPPTPPGSPPRAPMGAAADQAMNLEQTASVSTDVRREPTAGQTTNASSASAVSVPSEAQCLSIVPDKPHVSASLTTETSRPKMKPRRSSTVEESRFSENEEENNPMSLSAPDRDASWRDWAWYVLSLPIVVCLMLTVPDVRRDGCRKLYVASFVLSVVWIGVFTHWMVWFATIVARTLGMGVDLMGLTVLAAGTSVPDLLTSVIVARQGMGDMAVSSSIGSNIFDITVGLPVPWLLMIAFRGRFILVGGAPRLGIGLILLGLMLMFSIGMIVLNKWTMTRSMGFSMVTAFVVFEAIYVILALCVPDDKIPRFQ